MWPYFAPKPLRGGASKGWKVKMCEGGPPSLSLGRLAELCRAIRMFECAKAVVAKGGSDTANDAGRVASGD